MEARQVIYLELNAEQLTEDVLVLLSLEAKKQGLQLSKTQVKQAMKQGALWFQARSLNNKPKRVVRIRRLKRNFVVGDAFYLYYDEKVLSQKPTAAQLIADFKDYSLWYKPYGMYSQGSKWGDHCTIGRWSEQHLQPLRPAFLVHRLDRATRGLMLLAHSKKAAQALSAMFEKHELSKVYHALVHGDIREQGLTFSINSPIDGKPACSHISYLETSPCAHYSLVSVSIDTGRKHQIRRHLSELAHPIVGDRLYGIEQGINGVEAQVDLQLVSSKLAFICPLSHVERSFELPAELTLKMDVLC